MEKWDVYDINKKITGKTHIRGEKLKDGEYHLYTHTWICNNNGEFLIQRRSMSKTLPGIYATHGGSVIAGEISVEGARREIIEEVGLDIPKNYFKLIYEHTNVTKEHPGFMDMYFVRYDFDINRCTLDPNEVMGVMTATLNEIEDMILEGVFFDHEEIFGSEYIDALRKASSNL